MILLDPIKIKKILPDNVEIIVLESIDSTNNFFKTHCVSDQTKLYCCFAEQQTQGRGRLNRKWQSPFGKNLYFSCYYAVKKNIKALSGLSLVVGLSIVSALRALEFTQDVYIKWPNDVLCQQKKIAGILMEIHSTSSEVSCVIIGIGLNVNMVSNDELSSIERISQPWTSLCEERGFLFDRNDVAAVLLQHLLNYLQRFEKNGLSEFFEEWTTVDGLYKKEITLLYKNEFMTGEAMGINQEGHLLLRLPDNTMHAFSSGEVSLMKKQ